MPRKFFRKYLPDPAKLHGHSHLRMFRQWLRDPNLWHLNRHSIASGMFIGLFCAVLPMPQMLPAALLAIYFRANLPLSVALVWLTNPLTAAPVMYGSYLFGAWLLGMHTTWDSSGASLEAMAQAAWNNFGQIYLPLLVGSLLIGLALGALGWLAVHYIWRLHVVHHWKLRSLKRQPKDDSGA